MKFLSSLKSSLTKFKTLEKDWTIPLLLAVATSILIYKEINKYKLKLGHNMATEVVLAYRQPFAKLTVLSEGDFTRIEVPRKYLPSSVLRPGDEWKIAQSPLKQDVGASELVLWSAFDIDTQADLPSSQIPHNYRMISVPVDNLISHGSRITAGDKVDLISQASEAEDDGSTFALIQNVTVINVGDRVESLNENDYSLVSLMLMPKEVNLVLHAMQKGKIFLALRNPTDAVTSEEIPIVRDTDYFKAGMRNALQKERNKAIEIFKAGVKVTR